MRVKLSARDGYVPFPLSAIDPVELTVILGDDAAGGAGKCGRGAYVVGDCRTNQSGLLLRCKR